MLFRLRATVLALAFLLDAPRITTAGRANSLKRLIAGAMMVPTLLYNANVQIDPGFWTAPSQPPMTLSTAARADDELAKYAAEGNPVVRPSARNFGRRLAYYTLPSPLLSSSLLLTFSLHLLPIIKRVSTGFASSRSARSRRRPAPRTRRASRA